MLSFPNCGKNEVQLVGNESGGVGKDAVSCGEAGIFDSMDPLIRRLTRHLLPVREEASSGWHVLFEVAEIEV